MCVCVCVVFVNACMCKNMSGYVYVCVNACVLGCMCVSKTEREACNLTNFEILNCGLAGGEGRHKNTFSRYYLNKYMIFLMQTIIDIIVLVKLCSLF